jgi:DNA-directed RNA polymerase specialized sigma24 family protein
MDKKKKHHRYLREALRHYNEFEALFSQTGKSVVRGPDGVEICFLDLKAGFERLSKRKREAIYYNVVMDMRQKDVAEVMGITTVSVGQYVESGFMQFAEEYFREPDPIESSEEDE